MAHAMTHIETLEAENAKLRADNENLLWNLAAISTIACSEDPEHEPPLGMPGVRPALTDTIRVVRKLVEVRKELDALRAAPSDAEIEAWQDRAKVWAATALVRDAVALMRRARTAPAPLNSLCVAAKEDAEVRPDAGPSVVAPEDVRAAASGVASSSVSFPREGLARKCADWILSLPASPAPLPSQAEAADEELQRLLEHARAHCQTWGSGYSPIHALLAVIEAMAQRLGAR